MNHSAEEAKVGPEDELPAGASAPCTPGSQTEETSERVKSRSQEGKNNMLNCGCVTLMMEISDKCHKAAVLWAWNVGTMRSKQIRKCSQTGSGKE